MYITTVKPVLNGHSNEIVLLVNYVVQAMTNCPLMIDFTVYSYIIKYLSRFDRFKLY